MRSSRIFLVICTLILLVTAAVPVRQVGNPELALGEWLGQGVASGSTYTEDAQGKIAGIGNFTVNMEFIVPESGELNGTWTLDGHSSWDFTFYSSETSGEAAALMTHTADGPVTGTPAEFSLGVAQIESDISATGGTNLHSSDPVGPIDLAVTAIECNDAWGEWILSWNMDLTGAGYTPSFDGDWYAVRQEGEFTEDVVQEIFDKSSELNQHIEDTYQSASEYQGIPVIPADILWGLIYDTAQIYNNALNLGPCDKARLGKDGYENWIYAITQTLAGLAKDLLQQYDLAGQTMPGAEILELTYTLQATGAMGAGSQVDSSDLESGFEADIGEILTSPDHDNEEKQAAYGAAENSGLDVPADFDPSTIY